MMLQIITAVIFFSIAVGMGIGMSRNVPHPYRVPMIVAIIAFAAFGNMGAYYHFDPRAKIALILAFLSLLVIGLLSHLSDKQKDSSALHGDSVDKPNS